MVRHQQNMGIPCRDAPSVPLPEIVIPSAGALHLSPEYIPETVLSPESFRGGCSFGTGDQFSRFDIIEVANQKYLSKSFFICDALNGKTDHLTKLKTWHKYRRMMDPYFFGYGSLVNIKTHIYENPRPARLSGWRRVWRRTDVRDMAFLTIVPDATTELKGLIAKVPNADWRALDEREYGYDRLGASDQVSHDHHPELEVAIYSIPQSTSHAPTDQHPILLSYLDVVLQGYLHVYGQEGVHHFMTTTEGWATPILNDRAAPRYPRAQMLSSDETALVDHHLRAVNARIFDAV